MSSRKQDIIRLELEKIRNANLGKLTREAVVKYARANKRSALNKLFDWNVARAAQQHWLERAGEVIARYVTVVVTHRSEIIRSPFYVRDPDAKTTEPGYVALEPGELDRRQARQVMLNELERCQFSIERARSIAGVLDAQHPGISAELEAMLEKLILLRDRLAA